MQHEHLESQAPPQERLATKAPPQDMHASTDASRPTADAGIDRGAPGLAAAGPTAVAPEVAPSAESPPITKPSAVRSPGPAITWTAALFIMYATIAALLLVRFLVAYLLAQRLARRATPITPPLDCRAKVATSDEILVPLTVGLVRPRILLPADWRRWDAALAWSVLAHEDAHIERRDYLVLLAGELNRALFWFHPLAWFLRRHLSLLAEQCCDDAVIASSADRRDYAQHLLTIARRLQSSPRRVAPLGISMARSSRVESRIAAILDAERPLARRLGHGAALALVAIIAPVILLAAGLRAASDAPEQAAPAPAAAAASEPVTDEAGPTAEVSSNNDQAAKTADDSQGDAPSTTYETAPSGVPLQGHVVKESDGTKAAGAEIRLLTYNTQRTHYDVRTTTSDAAGNFTFDNVAAGDHRLLALLDDLASRATRYQGQKVTIDPQHPPTQPVVLRLSPAPSIQVHVQDLSTGKPIADAAVKLIWSDTGQGLRTDAEGNVLVRGLTPEVWHVRIEAAGYAAQVRPMNLSGDSRADASFQLVPGGRVQGVVKDETGKPIPGFGINVYGEDRPGDYSEYTKSDADGHYHFDFLPLDEEIKLRGWDDKYLNLDQHGTIRSDGTRDVKQDLVLRRRPNGGSVKGIVTDRAGKPIAGAKLVNQGMSSSIDRRTTTDEAGRFTIDDLLEGSMGKQLIVKAAGFAPQKVTVRPGPSSSAAEVTIKLDPGHEIRGQILDTSGKPIAGATIYYARGDQYPDGGIGGRATADDQGRFAIDSLAPQTPFSFRAAGFSPIAERVLPLDGEDAVQVTLLPEGMIRGRVIDATTGAPIPRFKVRITFSPDRNPADPSSGLSGPRAFDGEWFEAADGTFRLDDLVTGMPLQVTVEARQYGVQTLRRVVAVPEADAKVVEFKLAPLDPAVLTIVSGTITNERGQKMPYAELRLIVADKRPSVRDEFPFNWQMIHSGQVEHVDNVWQFLKARSDEQGRFHFDGVRADGDLELAYWGDGVSEARLSGLEKMSNEERHDLHLSCITPGEVRGLINRAKLAEATAVSASSPQRVFTEWFDEQEDDVAYALRNLPPGNYQLQLYGERIPSRLPGTGFTSRIIERRPIVVESGKTLDIDFGYDAAKQPPPAEKSEAKAEAKNSTPPPPKDDTPKPDEKKPATDERTDESKATPANEKSDEQLTLHGTVRDDAGQPIGGALVRLPVQSIASRTQESLGASATCDAAGRFALTIQRKWLTPARSAPQWALWAYAPGHALAGVRVYKQLFQGDESDIEVKLGPATDTAFRIIDPRGAGRGRDRRAGACECSQLCLRLSAPRVSPRHPRRQRCRRHRPAAGARSQRPFASRRRRARLRQSAAATRRQRQRTLAADDPIATGWPARSPRHLDRSASRARPARCLIDRSRPVRRATDGAYRRTGDRLHGRERSLPLARAGRRTSAHFDHRSRRLTAVAARAERFRNPQRSVEPGRDSARARRARPRPGPGPRHRETDRGPIDAGAIRRAKARQLGTNRRPGTLRNIRASRRGQSAGDYYYRRAGSTRRAVGRKDRSAQNHRTVRPAARRIRRDEESHRSIDRSTRQTTGRAAPSCAVGQSPLRRRHDRGRRQLHDRRSGGCGDQLSGLARSPRPDRHRNRRARSAATAGPRRVRQCTVAESLAVGCVRDIPGMARHLPTTKRPEARETKASRDTPCPLIFAPRLVPSRRRACRGPFSVR